jgi:uncharacterized repeat protein (TIGR03803 family)
MTLCTGVHGETHYKVLHSFGSGNDGAGLWGSVIVDKRGHVYGTTSGGGKYNGGTVFKLKPHPDGSWTEAVLHNFYATRDDGAGPFGGPILSPSGNLYGTTEVGGKYHYGTVFELIHTPSGWEESVLYSFGTQSEDGGEPVSGLVMDSAGNLYGTAQAGGEPDHNDGTVFKLTPGPDGWNETVLYTFCLSHDGCSDGVRPYAGVIMDASGNLYGTTQYGGTGCGSDGCGTVYRLRPLPDGTWEETVLHRFNNDGKDGVGPGWGSLFMDGSGRLYGTTNAGGSVVGGIIYKLTSQPDGSWKESILHNFKRDAKGYSPNTGVVMDQAGNIYGTTDYGGDGCGVIYRLSTVVQGKRTYTVLHTFRGPEGCLPEGNLVPDEKGNLYGVTALGGAYGPGVVFKIVP